MAYVTELTIDSAKVSADLTDFIVYVDLSDLNAGFWSTVANGGGDIRVYKSDGTTELAREIVFCNTANDTGGMHVKYSGTLSSSSDTIIQIHADGSSSDYAVTGTYGRNNVWSNLEAVSHDGGATADSTGTYTLTGYGGVTAGGATGKIGAATDYDGTNDYTAFTGTVFDPNSDYTISFWINLDTDSSSNFALAKGVSVTVSPGYWGINFRTDTREAGVQLDDGPIAATYPLSGTGNVLASDGLTLVHTTRSGDDYEIFKNGSSLKTGTNSLTGLNNTNDLTIGRLPVGTNYLNGTISEVRILTSVLSSSWITTEYNNQNNTATFYSAIAPGGSTIYQPTWFM